jgi:hypothetical protein
MKSIGIVAVVCRGASCSALELNSLTDPTFGQSGVSFDFQGSRPNIAWGTA